MTEPRREAATESVPSRDSGATVEDGPGLTPEQRVVPTLVRGSTIGRYLLLDRLGAGGMGVVWSAFDPQLDRKIAIKLLRRKASDGDGKTESSSSWQLRLHREAKAMARLSHPNVAAVYDVGVLDHGQIFVAMELVDGVTLRDWLAEKPRNWRDVLEMFRTAGAGIAAAHEADLVHRDFKPDNVMVGRDGRVRVMDFGLARATSQSEDEIRMQPKSDASSGSSGPALSAPLTKLGAVQGTPGYMAPEQWRGEPVDARCDQFSYAVALYEALYGERPFEGLPFERAETERWTVRDPPRATRVPTWLRRTLLRSLSEDPNNRYPSMADVLVELGRDPAAARRRWVFGAVAALSVVAIGIGARRLAPPPPAELCKTSEAALGDAWSSATKARLRQAFDASGNSRSAEVWSRIEQRLDAYARGWIDMRTDACLASRVRGEQSDAVLLLRTACLDRRKLELAALTRVLAGADEAAVDKAVDAVAALPDLASCANVAALQSRVDPPPAAIRQEVERMQAEVAEARARLFTGHGEQSKARSEQLVVAAKALGYRPLETDALVQLALSYRDTGDARAVGALGDALSAALATNNDELALKSILNIIARAAEGDGDIRDTDPLLKAARGLLERLGQPDVLTAIVDVGEAEVLSSRRGKHEEALGKARSAVSLLERARGGDDYIIRAILRVGIEQEMLGRYDEAIETWTHALEVAKRIYGEPNLPSGVILLDIGDAENHLGNYERGVDAGLRAIASFEQTHRSRAAQLAVARSDVAEALLGLGRLDEAERACRDAIQFGMEVMGDRHPRVAEAFEVLGRIQLRQQKPKDALASFERARAIVEEALGPTHSDLTGPLTGIGRAELALGHPDRARPPLERALTIEAATDLRPEARGTTQFALAKALTTGANRDTARARELAKQAHEGFVATHAPEADEIGAWLARRP